MKTEFEKQLFTMHNGKVIEREITKPIIIGELLGKTVYAKFYTEMSNVEVGAYDWDFFTPLKPLNVEDYDFVCDYFKTRIDFCIENGKGAQFKQESIESCIEMYNYQQTAPLLKVEIDKFLEINPQFVYGRIFS